MSLEQTEDVSRQYKVDNQSPATLPFSDFFSFIHSDEENPDLKAFERRLTEVISQLHPITIRWRVILIVTATCTVAGAWYWLRDPETTKVSFFDSLLNHPFFAISCIILCLLFVLGIHKRVVAPSIIASRCRSVLTDYNMSCDDTGKLILKPRPAST